MNYFRILADFVVFLKTKTTDFPSSLINKATCTHTPEHNVKNTHDITVSVRKTMLAVSASDVTVESLHTHEDTLTGGKDHVRQETPLFSQ